MHEMTKYVSLFGVEVLFPESPLSLGPGVALSNVDKNAETFTPESELPRKEKLKREDV